MIKSEFEGSQEVARQIAEIRSKIIEERAKRMS